jgi:hypothetical protein
MNVSLLSRFADELRAALLHHYFDEPRWFSPVLSLPSDRGRNHLVVVLETPGPFCFLRAQSPFEGADAPVRLSVLKGAEVTGVSADGRVLVIDALTRREQWNLTLRVSLFGANGSATLSRGDAVMETLGRPARSAAPSQAAPPVPVTGRFELVARGRVSSAMPRVPGAVDDEAAVRSLGVFDDARAACAHVGELVLGEAQALMLHRIARPARRKLESLRKLSLNLESDLDQASAHRDERREAEALAAYQTRVRPGADTVDVPDLYEPGRTLRITLDPALPVHVQVEKRFRRAAKLEKALAHLTRRLELVRTDQAGLGAALELLGKVESFAGALKLYEVMRARFGIALERTTGASASPRKAAREKTYRTFELDPRWYVMVGRSNQENDEITFRVSAPGDWWFHAEGVPGSHVVLRPRGGTDAPPARIIEQAASVAAHYSKARHSGLVPVIYTLRKYVRKFRGAEPGQVKCERETMVMVPPVLPGEAPEES